MSKQPLDFQRVQTAVGKAIDILEKGLESENEHVQIQAASAILAMTPLPMAAYSFDGELSNQSPFELKLVSSEGLDSKATKPPDHIPAGGSGEWFSNYDGCNFYGKVIYQVKDNPEQTLTMTWNIPLFGDNTITAATNIPGFTAKYKGGRGWHATVLYTLEAQNANK
ncbi:MAG: hypothetical protein ACRBF0_15360 [Calditrichia bacterium]